MIDRLIAFLQDKELLLSDQAVAAYSEARPLLQDEDIADVLWLADKIGGAYELNQATPEPSKSDGDRQTIQTNDTQPLPEPPPPAVAVSLPETQQPDIASVETPEQGLPIQVQAAPALPDTRSIARGLRPLMHKVPSLTASVLDELATVNRIAERDIWLPILKPAPERWFELELVIESSEFSFIWRETLDEFQHLLECQGAFRNVRSWLVQASDTGHPRLIAKKQKMDPGQPNRSPKELVDASGRRLVLLVSDCRSNLWQRGKIHDWLALWSQHGPAAIVQLLPERLWSQSELDVGFAVQVGALTPGVPNDKLQVREMPGRTKISPADSLTVPVVTLTASALKQWALVVSAAGRQRSPARLFDLSWVKDPNRDTAATVIHPDLPEARVELFKATASPWAQQLANRLAAVPVDLSVINLIQQELLPQVKPVHVAEVYSSGLLEPQQSSSGSDDSVRYNFFDGVRRVLNKATPKDQTLEVIEALSQRIARTLGFEIRSFTALLIPKSDWSQEVRDAILPFAQITTEVLHRLGGDYAELAKVVEEDATGRSDWIRPTETDSELTTTFPELEPFDFIDARLSEQTDRPPFPPQLDTEDFTILNLTSAETLESTNPLDTFEITVATFIQIEDQWQLQRQPQTAHRYIEIISPESTPEISLEMVAIPSGTFLMGSPDDEVGRYDDESPPHEVTIDSFFMGRYPITQAQWRAVASMKQVKQKIDPDPSNFKGDNRPVEKVSWYDAIEFCARLSAHTGREYRLPTEAEWEYACRAGTTTPFHFGHMITTEVANYNGSTYANGPEGEARNETTSVDYFCLANAFGLSDMHGNVNEWCQDQWHGDYEAAPTDGSAWEDQDDEAAARVYRGGSWGDYPRNCRSAYRYNYIPDDRINDIGFRVVCSAPRILP